MTGIPRADAKASRLAYRIRIYPLTYRVGILLPTLSSSITKNTPSINRLVNRSKRRLLLGIFL